MHVNTAPDGPVFHPTSSAIPPPAERFTAEHRATAPSAHRLPKAQKAPGALAERRWIW